MASVTDTLSTIKAQGANIRKSANIIPGTTKAIKPIAIKKPTTMERTNISRDMPLSSEKLSLRLTSDPDKTCLKCKVTHG